MKPLNLRETLLKNVTEQNLKEVKTLLDHHPHLLSANKSKFNLILRAVENNDIALMALLEKYNPDPNIKRKHLTSLHIAIQRKVNIKIINSLLALSAELDAPDKYGNTPLHYATRIGDTKVIKLLINADANINYMNNNYLTPLEMAQKYKKIKASCLLIRAGAKRKQPFFETIKLAYSTSNIYRKIIVFIAAFLIISTNSMASILAQGLLYPTIIISLFAFLGILILCLAKPFFRVKSLEQKIMNKQISHAELKELFHKPQKDQNLKIPATDLIPNATNDNFFLDQHKKSIKKYISDSKKHNLKIKN